MHLRHGTGVVPCTKVKDHPIDYSGPCANEEEKDAVGNTRLEKNGGNEIFTYQCVGKIENEG